MHFTNNETIERILRLQREGVAFPVHPHHYDPEFGSFYREMLGRYTFLLRVSGISARAISNILGIPDKRAATESSDRLRRYADRASLQYSAPQQEWALYRRARIQYESDQGAGNADLARTTGYSLTTVKRDLAAPTPDSRYFARVLRAMGTPLGPISSWLGVSPEQVCALAPDHPFALETNLVPEVVHRTESVRNYLIRHAVRAEEPVSRIATRFGISKNRVYQIAPMAMYSNSSISQSAAENAINTLSAPDKESTVIELTSIESDIEIPDATVVKHAADDSLLDMLPEASVSRQTSDAVIKPISGDDLRGVLLACADQIKMAARDGEYSTTVAYRHLDDKRVQQASRSEHGIAVLLEPAIRMLEARGYTVDVTLRMDTRVQLLISVGWQ